MLNILVGSIRVIAFDHQKSTLSRISSVEHCPDNLTFHTNVEKSSARAVYDYFSEKLAEVRSPDVGRGH